MGEIANIPDTSAPVAPRRPARSAPAATPPAAPAPATHARDLLAGLPDLSTRTLADIHALLLLPFPRKVVELKPGAFPRDDKTRALALAYVDARVYQARLDLLAGAQGWSVEYRQLSERALLCRLTILGVYREDVGESDTREANATTSAAMQAFKRACAAFGLGRYLYALPQLWADYDDAKKTFVKPEQVVREIYARAELLEQAREATL